MLPQRRGPDSTEANSTTDVVIAATELGAPSVRPDHDFATAKTTTDVADASAK
jgi:hypothetical protein